jgi:nucleolar protein 58
MFICLQVIRLKDFQTFEDKTTAIKLDTGVSDQLGRMIKKWLRTGQKLAVGKPEYKTIIEASLVSVSFSCLLCLC